MDTAYVIRAEDTSSQVVEGELLVINFETSYYYGPNRTASAVWGLLGSPRSTAAITEVLAGPFKTDAETIRTEVGRLLNEFLEEGLVMEAGGATGVQAPTADIEGGGWERPSIERYERLDQLILSGE
jgi:hypothetical protein